MWLEQFSDTLDRLVSRTDVDLAIQVSSSGIGGRGKPRGVARLQRAVELVIVVGTHVTHSPAAAGVTLFLVLVLDLVLACSFPTCALVLCTPPP